MSAEPLPAVRKAAASPPAPLAVLDFIRNLPARLERPVSGGRYRPEIDGLRFFAIAIVVIGHLSERLTRFFPPVQALADHFPHFDLLQRPGLGVYLFFAISGFILASQAMRAKTRPLSLPFLRAYFGRRVLRIEPPYVLLLVATFLFLAATGYAPEGTRQFDTQPDSLSLSLLGSVFYLHDLVWGTYPRLFPPGWSLEVEVQFYFVAPLFFALWLGPLRPGARLLLGVTGLVGGSLLSLQAPDTVGPLHLYASILRFLHFFWLGLVLADRQAWIAARLAHTPPIVADLLGWGGLAVYILVPNAPDTGTATHLATGLALRAAALASVAAMFAAVFAPRSVFRGFCALPWISLVGGACYSLYLTHLQTIQATTALAAKLMPSAGLATLSVLAISELILVLVVGLAFYALVERTFMRPDWLQIISKRLGSSPIARTSSR